MRVARTLVRNKARNRGVRRSSVAMPPAERTGRTPSNVANWCIVANEGNAPIRLHSSRGGIAQPCDAGHRTVREAVMGPDVGPFAGNAGPSERRAGVSNRNIVGAGYLIRGVWDAPLAIGSFR
jgi:hypothetical protein